MIDAIGAISSGARTVATAGAGAMDTGLAKGADQTATGAGFEAIFDQITSGLAHSLKAGEQIATQGILGTGSVQATVEGVMAAEQSLQIGIGIRDKIVNAYLELSRMAI